MARNGNSAQLVAFGIGDQDAYIRHIVLVVLMT